MSLLPTLCPLVLAHELCAKSRSLLALHLPFSIPDLGKQRIEDLASALLELTFQSGRPTNACEIIRGQYLAIDIWCENAEGIQKKGKVVVVWDSFIWETFRRRCILEELSDFYWQKGGDSWQGKNRSKVQMAGITVVVAGEHHTGLNWRREGMLEDSG